MFKNAIDKNGPDQVAFDGRGVDYPVKKSRNDGPDQVAFDGYPIDYPKKEPLAQSFNVYEVSQNSPLKSASKSQSYLKKIEAVDLKIEHLESKRNELLDIDYEYLKPSQRTILDEYPSKVATLLEEKRIWQKLLDPTAEPSVIQLRNSTFERDVLKNEYVQPRVEERALVPSDSISNTLYAKDSNYAIQDTINADQGKLSNNSPVENGKHVNSNPPFSTRRKKWIIGISVFILAIITALVCYFTLARPNPPQSSTPPQRTGPATSFTVSTFAGSGVAGYRDGALNVAQFDNPLGVTIDPTTGDVIVSDLGNNRIRRISNGIVSTIAGDGTRAFADGPVASARFASPQGVVVASNGDIYVADTDNNRIRVISNGVVRTIAGNGTSGYQNGPALDSTWTFPIGIVTGRNGDIYVSDFGKTVRRISGGTVSTFAGSLTLTNSPSRDGVGNDAILEFVSGIAFDSNGNMVIGEVDANRLRRITPERQVSMLATNFTTPGGICIDQFNTVYVAEYADNKISGLTLNGTKFFIAGTGFPGNSDGAGKDATFNIPSMITIDTKGVLYVSDRMNHRIRMITPQ